MQSFIRELRNIENWFTQSRATHNGDDYSFEYIVLMGMLVTFVWMKCYLKKGYGSSLAIAIIWGSQVGCALALAFMVLVKILNFLCSVINWFCRFWLS